MSYRTCTIEGCTKAHRAKGLCVTHYNQASSTARPTMIVPCDVCGTDIVREKRNAQKYPYNRCSELCRQWREFGAWSSTLPQDHWARHYGSSCTVRIPALIICEWCGTQAFTRRTQQRFCTKTCKTKQGKATRRGREFNAAGTYSWSQLVRLWIAFDRSCAYCAQPTPLHMVQAEHVHPLSRGGRNDLANLLPSCGPCNSDKRDLLLTEWNADRQRRNLTPRTTAWSDTDQRYAHLIPRTSLSTAA